MYFPVTCMTLVTHVSFLTYYSNPFFKEKFISSFNLQNLAQEAQLPPHDYQSKP